MRTKRNRRLLAGLVVLLAAGFGCNPLLAPFYFFGGVTDSKEPPDFQLYTTAKRDKKKKEIKIVILPYRSKTLSPDFIGKERSLATAFVRQLTERFAANKEHVKIVSIHDVEKFKSEHQDWRTMKACEIGPHFNADYVIDMDVLDLSLFERKSHGMFFNGYCRISLTVKDVDKDGEEPLFTREYAMQFPKQGPRVADLDDSVDKFQQDFFAQVATRLCWALTPHPTTERCDCE